MMYQRSIGKHFFISHSSRDKEIARKLRIDLEAKRLPTWMDDDIDFGQQWDIDVETAIPQSIAVLYLVSPTSHTSRAVKDELDMAANYDRPIIPLWIGGEKWKNVAIMGYRRMRYLDMRGDQYNKQITMLQNQLLRLLNGEELEQLLLGTETTDNIQTENLQDETSISQEEGQDTSQSNGEIGMVGAGLVPARRGTHTGASPAPTIPTSRKPIFRFNLMQSLLLLFGTSKRARTTSPQIPEPSTPAFPGTNKLPYKGLSAFNYRDADIFFGRQHMIKLMARKIKDILDEEKHDSQTSRCLLVIGASGSGKSSVVMAGLLPYLQKDALSRDREREFPEIKRWLFLEPVKPGEHPLEALAQALSTRLLNGREVGTSKLENLNATDVRSELNDPDAHGLCNLLRKIAVRDDERAVLIIDQFEELFAPTTTTDRAQYTQFINLLIATAIEPESRTIIILTLRGDFYDDILKNRRLYQIVREHKIDIPPMEREELREVIIKPARMADVELETDLVGDLLSEMRKQPEALPLLQFTLEELFYRSEDHVMTRRTYEHLGGLDGAINRHAENVYKGLSQEEQQCAQELLTRYFIYLREPLDDVSRPGSSKEVTRRRVTRTELTSNESKANLRLQIVNTFVKERLFTAQRTATGETIYEISHEALINSWERLRGWIDPSWETIHFYQRTRARAEKWQQEKNKELLYSENDFKRLKEYYDQNKLESDTELRFYQACKREQMRKENLTRGRYTLAIVVPLLAAFLLARFTDLYYMIRPQPSEITVVTTLQETGDGSLLQAIKNAVPGATITFKPGLKGTLHLQEQDLVLNKDLRIQGPPDQSIVITSGNTGRKIHVLFGADVTFENLQLKDSHTHGTGFLLNEGMMTLRNSLVSGNSSDYNGGGIFNLNGTLNLVQTTVAGNTASGNGGGIYNQQGTVNLEKGCKINNNRAFANGGGILGIGGSISVHNAVIFNNRAEETVGGGIDVQDGALIVDSDSELHDNRAAESGGGIALQGSNATISDTSIDNNRAGEDGGGILVAINTDNNTPGSMIIQNIDIAGNPNARYFIGKNQVTNASNHKTNDISGNSHMQGEEVVVTSAEKGSATGNPPPRTALPQTLPNYLGIVNARAFCQKHYYSYAELAPQDAKDTDVKITCLTLDSQRSEAFAASDLCKEQYSQYNNVIDRLADYFDPVSLQCYRDVRPLINSIATEANIKAFCQNYLKYRDLYHNAASRKTAYDWKCLTATGQPVGFDVADLCRYVSHVDTAFDRLTNYYRPDGWECWAPNVSIPANR
jgi:hypothetical protein